MSDTEQDWPVSEPVATPVPKTKNKMRKLDRNVPYGEVHGASNGAVYEQDGVLFGANGEEIQ